MLLNLAARRGSDRTAAAEGLGDGAPRLTCHDSHSASAAWSRVWRRSAGTQTRSIPRCSALSAAQLQRALFLLDAASPWLFPTVAWLSRLLARRLMKHRPGDTTCRTYTRQLERGTTRAWEGSVHSGRVQYTALEPLANLHTNDVRVTDAGRVDAIPVQQAQMNPSAESSHAHANIRHATPPQSFAIVIAGDVETRGTWLSKTRSAQKRRARPPGRGGAQLRNGGPPRPRPARRRGLVHAFASTHSTRKPTMRSFSLQARLGEGAARHRPDATPLLAAEGERARRRRELDGGAQRVLGRPPRGALCTRALSAPCRADHRPREASPPTLSICSSRGPRSHTCARKVRVRVRPRGEQADVRRAPARASVRRTWSSRCPVRTRIFATCAVCGTVRVCCAPRCAAPRRSRGSHSGKGGSRSGHICESSRTRLAWST